MICGSRCGLSWRIFHIHLRRKCILLHLDGKSWRYQLGKFGLMFHLRVVFHYWVCFDDLSICVSGGFKFPLLLHYCQFLLLCLLVFALCTEVFLCWVHQTRSDQKYLQLFCPLLGLTLDNYVVSFFVAYNILYFKVYFVWSQDCHSGVLLVSIHMEYLFPSFTFSLYVFLGLKWISFRYHIYMGLVLYLVIQSVSFGWCI